MQRQDLNKLQNRKVKALKRKLDTKPDEEKKDEKNGGSEVKGGSKKKRAKTETANGSYDD
jgi:hypothetical protein